MQTRVVATSAPNALEQALEALKQGGLVAFPTDTVYGLGADPFNEAAVQRLYIAKGRPAEKAIPILLDRAARLDEVASSEPAIARALARAFWPGPLTLVVPRHPALPPAVSPLDSVGVRVPDHPDALALLARSGPLAVTSANRSGHPSARTAEAVFEALGGRIDLILDGGAAPGGQPSTVVDCTGDEFRILRPGPIDEAALRGALGA